LGECAGLEQPPRRTAMYLDVFKTRSDEENFRGLRISTAMLSLIILMVIVIAESEVGLSRGTERAIIVMMAFGLLCLPIQGFLQRKSNALRPATYFGAALIYCGGIFRYFLVKYRILRDFSTWTRPGIGNTILFKI
jgi:hypothetical protein